MKGLNYLFLDFSFIISPGVWIFSVLLVLIFFCCLYYSCFYINNYKFFTYFLFFFNRFFLSMFALTKNKRNQLLFFLWDMLGLTSFFLVLYYINVESVRGSINTLFRNRFGDLMALILISIDSSLRFYFLFFIDFLLVAMVATKRAQGPFIGWLPRAIAAPTPVSSLVHRRTLVTAGFFVLEIFFSEVNSFELLGLLFLSFVRMLYSSVFGVLEDDSKEIIALRTLSQVGLFLLFYSLGYYFFSKLHLLRHAFFKALLFFRVGYFINKNEGGQDFRVLRGFWWGFLSLRVLVSMFSLFALYFIGGILRKDLFLEFFLELSALNVVLRLLFFWGFILTFFYTLKLYKLLVVFKSNLNLNFSVVFFVVLILLLSFRFYYILFVLRNFYVKPVLGPNSYLFWVFFLFFIMFYKLLKFWLIRLLFVTKDFFSYLLSLYYRARLFDYSIGECCAFVINYALGAVGNIKKVYLKLFLLFMILVF